MFSFVGKKRTRDPSRAGGAGQVFFFGQMACAPRGRAGGAGLVFSFGQVALRSAQARGRAGFFFELVLALVARGMFYLTVKWLALRAGQSAGLFFSLSRFARRWRGAVFSLAVKWLCAPRGPEVGRGVSTPPSLPLDSTLPATS